MRITSGLSAAERKSTAPFPDPAEGFYVNGSVTSTDDGSLVPFTAVLFGHMAFAFLGMPPGDIAGLRLIVGDAANGDSILTSAVCGSEP